MKHYILLSILQICMIFGVPGDGLASPPADDKSQNYTNQNQEETPQSLPIKNNISPMIGGSKDG